MALTQTNVDALEKALASGALQVDFPDGGRVIYRSVVELQQAIAYAKKNIGAVPVTQSFASFSKD